MSALVWRVKELAERRGYGVRQLATEAGLDEKTVRNIIAARATRVDLDTIARLSDALRVPPGALWDVRPSPAEPWTRTAGAAGRGTDEELDTVLSGAWEQAVDGALDRVLRSA